MHLPQVCLRVDAVYARRADQPIHRSSTFATAVSAEEQEVLPAEATTAQGVFGDVVINLCNAVVAIIDQRLPSVEQVVDGLVVSDCVERVSSRRWCTSGLKRVPSH